MTKRRDPLSYHHAVSVVADALGWAECAKLCGVSERAVRYWSDPDHPTEIRLIDAERLDRAFLEISDHAPFQRLYNLRVGAKPRPGNADVLSDEAAELARHCGIAIAATISAASRFDCPNQKRAARQALMQAIAKMSDCLASLGGGDA